MTKRGMTRREIHAKILQLLRVRGDVQTTELLKALGAPYRSGLYRKAHREIKKMRRNGEIYQYNKGSRSFNTLKKPSSAHMNTEVAQFLAQMQNCKYSERDEENNGIKIKVGLFTDLGEHLSRHDVQKMAFDATRAIKKYAQLELYQGTEEKFRVACLVCLTNI